MVAEEAQSSTCLECGRHLELGHRVIEGEHLGNLSLEGELQIGPKGNFGGSKARAARQMGEAYRIDGVPTVAIQGKYITSPSIAGTRAKAIAVMDHLVDKVRKENYK